MRSRNFYPRLLKTTGNVKRNRTPRFFFLLGLLLFSAAFCNSASAQVQFANNPIVFLQPCSNEPSSIGPLLETNGYNPAGAVLTYSVTISPANGVLNGVPTLVNASGLSASPSGVTYTPDPGSSSDFFVITVTDGSTSANLPFSVSVKPAPSITVPSPTGFNVCAGTTSFTISYSSPYNVGLVDTVLSYTGGLQTFDIPAGVNSIDFDILGARGGKGYHTDSPANPGKGGRMQGTLNVSGFSTLDIEVGGTGQDPTVLGAQGGYPNGGSTSFYFYGAGGAGGGSTNIRMGGNLMAVAGGGGGNGWDNTGALAGGAGGAYVGGNGSNNAGFSHATGGTQVGGGAGATYGGWQPGGAGTLGFGGAGSTQGISGGGGGGYYGGGGGVWSGGAGGSSYFNGAKVTNPVTEGGVNDTNGLVRLRYLYPGSVYSIQWTGSAPGQGFADVPYIPLPSSPIVVSIPAGAAPGTYNGILRVANSSCTSDPIAISVTIKPIPDVTISRTDLGVGDVIVCNGDTVTDVNFASIPGTQFNYTNSDPSIDTSSLFPLTPTGTGAHISRFIGYNPTDAPKMNTITVTPDYLGCVGTSKTINITVNPTPRLNSTTSPTAICSGDVFNYTATSPTLGGPVSFAWSRDTTIGITNNPANSAGDNINETLFNITAAQVPVEYTYTVSANGCRNTRKITAKVNPIPFFDVSATPAAICNNTVFSFAPHSGTAGTVFTWSRDSVSGLSNPSASGSDDPMEVLNNITAAPVIATYVYTLSATFSGVGCTNVQVVTDTVNPSPVITSPAVLPAICDSTLFFYHPVSPVSGAQLFWRRDSINGIANPSGTGTGDISERLVNTTAHAVQVTYVYIIAANNCIDSQTVKVTVNPRPQLIGSLTQPAICDSTTFSYLPTSFTVGTSFAWHRDSVAGISNPTRSSTGNPNEILHNTTPDPVTVTYLYTLTANGCANQQSVTVVVNPDPKITNTLTPAAICDSAVFSYPVTSATAGAAFKWYRPYVPGILQVAASGNGNPNEQLINTTNVSVSAVYVYTITANSCSNTQRVTVAVNPTPHLTSPATASVCSGERFTYVPGSFTAGATYTWVRNSVTNITPATASGSGSISDSMVNSTLLPIDVVFLYRLGIDGCVNNHTDKVTVTVKPKAPVPAITIAPGHDLCSNTMYMNFGASSAVPVNYSWSAVNATVWATGSTGQYAIVSFPNPGLAVVRLNSNLPSVGCYIFNTYEVNVGNSVSDNPQVIYFDGQFICLQTNEASYQWGYDDAYTLDSAILAGETNQNYTNTNPDFAHKHYWVMTTQNGCLQKTYYNVPNGVEDISDVAGIKVYPNPASDYVNVDINTKLSGNIQVDVYNMLGQKVASVPAQDHRAKINIASLPAGAYIIDCNRDGMKFAAARFIKN